MRYRRRVLNADLVINEVERRKNQHAPAAGNPEDHFREFHRAGLFPADREAVNANGRRRDRAAEFQIIRNL